MEHTKRAGWFKKGFNIETHITEANAAAARRNGTMGGRPWSIHYKTVAALNVGASCLLPWRLDAAGDVIRGQRAHIELVRRVSLRTGRAFAKTGGAAGMIVTRIK